MWGPLVTGRTLARWCPQICPRLVRCRRQSQTRGQSMWAETNWAKSRIWRRQDEINTCRVVSDSHRRFGYGGAYSSSEHLQHGVLIRQDASTTPEYTPIGGLWTRLGLQTECVWQKWVYQEGASELSIRTVESNRRVAGSDDYRQFVTQGLRRLKASASDLTPNAKACQHLNPALEIFVSRQSSTASSPLIAVSWYFGFWKVAP